MLTLINDYLQLGVDAGNEHSAWTLAMAVLFVAAVILRRQSRD
jgi:hypothetical protein